MHVPAMEGVETGARGREVACPGAPAGGEKEGPAGHDSK